MYALCYLQRGFIIIVYDYWENLLIWLILCWHISRILLHEDIPQRLIVLDTKCNCQEYRAG